MRFLINQAALTWPTFEGTVRQAASVSKTELLTMVLKLAGGCQHCTNNGSAGRDEDLLTGTKYHGTVVEI